MKSIADIPIGPKALYRFRQSAIDDVKKLKKKHEKLPAVNQSDEDCYKTGEIEGQMKYIKQKFDIEEKDFK